MLGMFIEYTKYLAFSYFSPVTNTITSSSPPFKPVQIGYDERERWIKELHLKTEGFIMEVLVDCFLIYTDV